MITVLSFGVKLISVNNKTRHFKEEGEALEEGLSNNVYASEDKILKIYTHFPLTSFYATFLELVTGNLDYISRNDRISVEKEIIPFIEEAGLKSPEILDSGDDFIVFQRIEGESGYQHLNNCTRSEAESFGRDLKSFLVKLHNQGVALRDARVSNYLIGDSIYSIDHEYASINAGRFFFFIDELTVTSSARQTERYHSFVQGFKPRKTAVFLSIFMAIYHSILFERNIKRFRRIFGSLRKDLMEQ